MNPETIIKTVLITLIAIFFLAQIWARRYDIRHVAKEIWYGKTRYYYIRVILYTDPFGGKWQPEDVMKYTGTIKTLKKENFKFRKHIREVAEKKLREMKIQGVLHEKIAL